MKNLTQKTVDKLGDRELFSAAVAEELRRKYNVDVSLEKENGVWDYIIDELFDEGTAVQDAVQEILVRMY